MVRAEAVDGRGTPGPDRPRFTLGDIRNQLERGGVVSLVGELAVLQPIGFGRGFAPRRDFYVAPLVPPQIAELTQRQVDALNAAAYYKRQPTRELAAVLHQFAEDYNRILKDMLPPDKFPGNTVRFGFVSNLASSRVDFGYRMYTVPDLTAQVTQRTDVVVQDPELQRQLARVQGEIHTATAQHPTDVRVRLFPQGLAERVYAYEKGFYVDGNVQAWSELVYKGRYISVDEITPQQLRDLARGEQPWPKVVYLPESEFTGDPAKIRELLVHRVAERESSEDMMFRGMPEVDDPSPELQTLLVEHRRKDQELGLDSRYGEGDFGENDRLMKEYYSRVGIYQGYDGTLSHRG